MMIRNLLSTTALVGASLVLAGTSCAAGGVAPAATFSGSTSFNAYGAPQKVRMSQGEHFGATGKFNVNVNGATSNGIGYGYTATFTTDTNATNAVDENYITLTADNMGTLILGDNDGVEDLMMYDGAEVMGGTGGFNGNWSQVFNSSTNALTQDQMLADTGDATKITYLSPTVAGFQAGLSYTPNSLHNGFANISQEFTGKYQTYTKNNVAAGLSYNNTFSGVSVTLSGVYMWAKSFISPTGTSNNKAYAGQTNNVAAQSALNLPANGGNPFKLDGSNTPNGLGDISNLKDVKSWMVGGVLGYGGFQLGGGYFDNGKSLTPKDAQGAKAGTGWNVALGYNTGPYSVAVGYFATDSRSSSTNKQSARVTSVTAGYDVAQGFNVYAEGNWINTKTKIDNLQSFLNGGEVEATPDNNAQLGRVGNNTGQVYILGTKISF